MKSARIRNDHQKNSMAAPQGTLFPTKGPGTGYFSVRTALSSSTCLLRRKGVSRATPRRAHASYAWDGSDSKPCRRRWGAIAPHFYCVCWLLSFAFKTFRISASLNLTPNLQYLQLTTSTTYWSNTLLPPPSHDKDFHCFSVYKRDVTRPPYLRSFKSDQIHFFFC